MTPTREELVQALEQVSVSSDPNWLIGSVDKEYEAGVDAIQNAISELQRTCATCQHFTAWDDGIHCRHKSGPLSVPNDGSGFCHRHEPKDGAA